ncbi:hypothetical protein OBBRIDRAFT_807035 [Obba rivulosa]|uniref:Uncharacterized protein n=1 Tax=Obba rivulosa TaxID=1052685 RepID=A0A8E2DHQ3_9APHY|nr:hypothetical protein OBBRIDRAFT_807035 [Obba rivulosa]
MSEPLKRRRLEKDSPLKLLASSEVAGGWSSSWSVLNDSTRILAEKIDNDPLPTAVHIADIELNQRAVEAPGLPCARARPKDPQRLKAGPIVQTQASGPQDSHLIREDLHNVTWTEKSEHSLCHLSEHFKITTAEENCDGHARLCLTADTDLELQLAQRFEAQGILTAGMQTERGRGAIPSANFDIQFLRRVGDWVGLVRACSLVSVSQLDEEGLEGVWEERARMWRRRQMDVSDDGHTVVYDDDGVERRRECCAMRATLWNRVDLKNVRSLGMSMADATCSHTGRIAYTCSYWKYAHLLTSGAGRYIGQAASMGLHSLTQREGASRIAVNVDAAATEPASARSQGPRAIAGQISRGRDAVAEMPRVMRTRRAIQMPFRHATGEPRESRKLRCAEFDGEITSPWWRSSHSQRLAVHREGHHLMGPRERVMLAAGGSRMDETQAVFVLVKAGLTVQNGTRSVR